MPETMPLVRYEEDNRIAEVQRLLGARRLNFKVEYTVLLETSTVTLPPTYHEDEDAARYWAFRFTKPLNWDPTTS